MAASVTTSFSSTNCAGPASAVGASLSALTVIVTVSTDVFVPSDGELEAREVFARPSGAVKVGEAACASFSTTVGPLACVQV
ncbi:MAG: hypothetical protein IPJ19_02755 [Planctomycetes bacterium]|nr:hypothetical protein [Planctomycetota bacterium]